MNPYTIRLASGEQDLPYVGRITTTPRVVWMPEEAVALLRAHGAIVNHADEPPVEADADVPAQPPAPGPVKPRKGR